MNLEFSEQANYVSNTPFIEVANEGVKTRIEPLIQDLTPLRLPASGLAKNTLNDLRSFFQRSNHDPSQAMWDALGDLAATLEQMANDECLPHYYLSSLDPGVGKTQTIVHFVRNLVTSQQHSKVGLVLCVSRLDEVRTLSQEMRLSDNDFAVLTSDDDLNALGSAKVDTAQVLITTQQMIERRCEGMMFEDATDFHFQEQARQVRIWDESILPGQTLTLNRDDISFLFKPLRTFHPKLVDTLETLFADLKDAKDGTTITVPDFTCDHSVDGNDVLRLIEETATRDQINSALSLWLLSGKDATVRRDGAYGNTVLDYRETLPGDLAPLVILDASGRVRSTYKQWEDKRGGLKRLKSATKKYDNLTLHAWTTGGSKSSFRKNGRDLIDGIASTINKAPAEEWLIVHHKAGINMNFENEVRSLLSIDQDKVHFTNWGNHHATNRFSHVPNVILAGTLFYRPSYYESLGRLAGGKRSGSDVLTDTDYKDVIVGEHRHLILQALCRGSVRKSIGDSCAPCNAYIIASVHSGIPDELPYIFPGCTVERWQPVKKALKGKAREATTFITEWLTNKPYDFLRFNIVQKAIGITDGGNFRKNIRKHPDFMEALANEGIVEHGNGKYPRGFVNAAAYGYISDPAEDF